VVLNRRGLVRGAREELCAVEHHLNAADL